MPKPLPSGAHLDHLKKQAKSLLKTGRQAETEAIRRFQSHHPEYATGVPKPDKLKLQEAQLVVAREYDFPSWPQLVAATKESKTDSPDTSGILILTNGESAVETLKRANIPGHKEEWLEVLHDGPVPFTETRTELNRIRAKHIASLGWSSEEGAYNRFQKRDALLKQHDKYQEMQLWFEHDLYDQLQLIQILDTLAERQEWNGNVKLVQTSRFITELSAEELKRESENPISIAEKHISLAQQAWSAFRQPKTDQIKRLVESDLSTLPHLKPALKRVLQENPDEHTGLGRTERQILEAVVSGADKLGPVFRHSQQQEEAAFMGDLSFVAIIDRLTQGKAPPLKAEGVSRLLENADPLKFETIRERRLQITDTGHSILSGNIRYQTPPYWLGGTQIT
ncbi:MAG: hypothetical protein AAGB46_17435 [Verrucomicrobiota bacterium]